MEQKPSLGIYLLQQTSPYLIKLWFNTCRVQIQYLAPVPKQAIYVGWHSILPAFLFFGRNRHMATMVSKSKDGDLITPVFKKLGFEAVRGSRYEGATAALKGMLKVIKKGFNVGLAIDGSRGPAHKAQGGALFLASYTGLPLIGVGVAYSHKITLPTWDKMEIPLPFCKIGLVLGEPLYFPKNMDKTLFQKKLLEIEGYLFKIYRQAFDLIQ